MFPTEYISKVADHFRSGSREICNPPPKDTDEDFAVFLRSYSLRREFEKQLVQDGWVKDGKEYDVSTFVSYRKADVNLILFYGKREYERYRLATRIATALNLLNKHDRIALFTMIRDAVEVY